MKIDPVGKASAQKVHFLPNVKLVIKMLSVSVSSLPLTRPYKVTQ